jgi:hypothetical protein
MTAAVIRRLRRLQGLGIVTAAHCACAERYFERHPEIFCEASMTLNGAVELAVESVRLTSGQDEPESGQR